MHGEVAIAEIEPILTAEAAEAVRRKLSFAKRTGGGFVVNFKPTPAFESREQPTPPAPSEKLSTGKEAAGGAGEAAALRRGLSTKSGWSESAAEP